MMSSMIGVSPSSSVPFLLLLAASVSLLVLCSPISITTSAAASFNTIPSLGKKTSGLKGGAEQPIPPGAAPPTAKTPAELLRSYNFSGVAKAWDGIDSSMWDLMSGISSLESRLPLEFDSRFTIASNTKLIVAIAMYQLQERGLFRVSDSIADHLNQTDFDNFGFPSMSSYCPTIEGSPACQIVTFEQLMSMTAGIPVDVAEEFLPFPGTLGLTVGRSINVQLLFRPGSAYYYSNPSFNLCGYFVEKFSSMKFGAYLAKYIFQPAGMTSSYFDPFNGKFNFDSKRAGEHYTFIDPTTYQLSGEGKCSSELDLGSIAGAGGVVSTLKDEMRLYFLMFSGLTKATGATNPFFTSMKPVWDIIRPRMIMKGDSYFGQGIAVYHPNTSSPLPELIFYEGGLLCTTTANTYDVNKNVLVQVFSNSPVYYITKEDLAEVQGGEVGVFANILFYIPTTPAVSQLSISILRLLFPGSPSI